MSDNHTTSVQGLWEVIYIDDRTICIVDCNGVSFTIQEGLLACDFKLMKVVELLWIRTIQKRAMRI